MQAGDPENEEPCADFIEQIAAAQIDKLAKSRSSEALQQQQQQQSDTLSPGSVFYPVSSASGGAAAEGSEAEMRPLEGFLTSGAVKPELVDTEVIDGYGFVVPPQHVASYTTHCKATAAMNELWKQRWGTWMQSVPSSKFVDPSDAVLAMTRGGIPAQFRAQIWLVASGADMLQRANPCLFSELVEAIARDNGQGLTLAAEVYDQVAKDLPRSIPSNIYFRDAHPVSQASLRRVLLAYALHNMSVGYCQGMNVLASVLLLLMPEEEAFFMLKTIVERILPSYFGEGLTGLTVDQNVVEAMMEHRAPDLIEHLNAIGMPMHVVTTRWLMCIFTTAMPSEGALRIWDCVILEGRKALFRAVIALFEVLKGKLLSCPDCDTAFELLQSVSGRMWDASALVHLMNESNSAGMFAKKPIGAYVNNERLQEFRTRVKMEEQERQRKLAEPQTVRSGLFSSVKNWTNKQVAKLQRMKKSANWLDDVVKLIQENGLALSHTPKGLAQALLYIDSPGSLLPDHSQEWTAHVLVEEAEQLLAKSYALVWYLCFRLQEGDAHATMQATVGQQLAHAEVFYVNSSSAKWRPPYWMALDHKLKALVLVIRPSFPEMQLSDYVGPAVPFMEGFAHAGMVAGARWFLANATELLKQGLALHPGYSLVLTSHALGAGVALLTTLLLRAEHPTLNATCHNFSTPACISTELTALCEGAVTSVILEYDAIPALCLRRVGDLAAQIKPGALVLSLEEEQALESSMTEAQLQPLLVCARESVVMRRYKGREGETMELKHARINHAECSADGLALSPSMFSNHGLPAYFGTLQLLHQMVYPEPEVTWEELESPKTPGEAQGASEAVLEETEEPKASVLDKGKKKNRSKGSSGRA